MGQFKYTASWGTEYELTFYKTAYVSDGSLAIFVDCKNEYGDIEPFCTLTINTCGWYPEGYACIDYIADDLFERLVELGYAHKAGRASSGFATYTVAKFTDEFLNDVCIDAR